MTAQAPSEAASEWVEWGVAGRPFPGETQSGDLHVLARFDGGVLAALIDGLGHGIEAAQAAERAADVLAGEPGLPVNRLMERCHAALRGTRGAVMTLARFDAGRDELTWTAIGNVEAVLCRAGAAAARESIVPRNGVVGFQLPSLRAVSLPIACGDVLILASDGLDDEFILEAPSRTSAQDFADHLLSRYGKDTDDARVLVARYLGGSR